MRGSGIFSEDYTGTFHCAVCEDDFECEGSTNDWGSMAYAECPECGAELELEIDTEGGQDEDAAYDSYRESLLD
jgi:transcription elongation factor Elf1